MNNELLNLTVKEIIELAGRDLDGGETASRIARFITLSVKAQVGGGLPLDEQHDVRNLLEVL